jgi:aminoglycoside 6'-N-acetyltransferase
VNDPGRPEVADIAFSDLTRADFALLGSWLAAPHVARWWREPADRASLEATYGPSIDRTEPGRCFLVRSTGRPVGLVQCYRLADYPDWQRALAPARVPTDGAGIDYLLGPADLIGIGLGPVVIDRFVESVWSRYPEVPAVVASVAQANRRSWRALEKAGFTRRWSGTVVSEDPSDAGPSHVYQRDRDPAGRDLARAAGRAAVSPRAPGPG